MASIVGSLFNGFIELIWSDYQITDYKINEELWQHIKENMIPLYQFLTNKNFDYNACGSYDLDIENAFDVLWISSDDAEFVEKFQKKI